MECLNRDESGQRYQKEMDKAIRSKLAGQEIPTELKAKLGAGIGSEICMD